MILKILILLFLNAQSQVEVVFDEGNALYNQGNYTKAIEKYSYSLFFYFLINIAK